MSCAGFSTTSPSIEAEEDRPLKIDAIRPLTDQEARRFVPPLSDYKSTSPGWNETEYRQFEASNAKVVVGFWTGAPGEVTLDPWPYTEICSILTGRVAVRDHEGRQVEFNAGQAFMVPQGFVGDWVTLEPSSKIFVAIS
jgi:uncharacterized cupin superfamily protein